jgi:hypothetical protein
MRRLIFLFGFVAAFAEQVTPDLPQLVSLTVHPTTIRAGDEVKVTWVMRGIVSAELSWQPTNALDGHLESRTVMEQNGSIKVRLFESTIFTLTCRYPAGYCPHSLTAVVKVGSR